MLHAIYGIELVQSILNGARKIKYGPISCMREKMEMREKTELALFSKNNTKSALTVLLR